MIVPVDRGVCLIQILNISTANTETIPKTGPKNAPAIGPKKSNKVKDTLEPRILLKGICRAVKPRRKKRAKKNNFF